MIWLAAAVVVYFVLVD